MSILGIAFEKLQVLGVAKSLPPRNVILIDLIHKVGTAKPLYTDPMTRRSRPEYGEDADPHLRELNHLVVARALVSIG